jgi:DNA-binding PadR family transcriptional regulator
MNSSTHLPLTETTFYILLSLSALPRHGYAILKDVQELSEDRIQLSTGTLYGAIKRLLDQGWIIRLENEPDAGVDGRGKKVYQLTDYGRSILQAEVERLENLVRKASLRSAEDIL